MDSDYKLFDLKEEKKEKEKKNKKDHSDGYYKFINQFRNHLKKIENEYDGEDNFSLENHFNFINKYENEFEEQRENCSNCYNTLKEQISLIENQVPGLDINVFNQFFQNFEEYYSFFKKSQEVLKKFSEFNDETQNLLYLYKRKNFCIDALKEFVDKLSVENADRIEQYEILKEKFKNITESYDKLYKIYQETKQSSDLKQYDNINNKELMIKKLNEKIQDLNIENDRIKKMHFDCSRELEGLKMAVKVHYVLKSESDKYISELKFKMKKYEIDNKAFKEEIKQLKIENEKLNKDKEYLEEQININLETINKISMSVESKNIKDIKNDNLIDEREEKDNEEKDNSEISDFQGNALGDLLMDCQSVATDDEHQIENGQIKEDINIQSSSNKDNQEINFINNMNTYNTEDVCITIQKKQTSEKKDDSINENNKINDIIKKKEDIFKKVSFNINNLRNKESKSKHRFQHAESVKIKPRSKRSGNINSAYDIMFGGPTRIDSRRNINYFKQFFFLLFQSMKMNSDKVELFLNYDPETLYNECRSEHTPFHKFENWIEKKLRRKEAIENEKLFEDFTTISGIFCSALI
jgi:hypothetical protein